MVTGLTRDRAVKKVLISIKTKNKFYVKDLNEDFITNEGIVKAKDLNSKEEVVETNKGKKLYLLNPQFPDLWEKLHRGPQIITAKDTGLIIAKTGINKNYVIVDAGVGSGSLALSLANICKKVTAYEVNGEHLKIAEKNKEFFGMKNLEIKQGDVAQKMTEKNLDLITLDLPQPWEMVEKAEKALKMGAYLVVYLPNILQMKMFIDATRSSKIKVLETVELLERQWKMESNIARPETAAVPHTGFITFCRKF
ncbi:MAG: methyltransferase domain-containing protein [archaeon]|nr:methyltransferase domain-containing protein [Nanoarchaeota archaeon]